MNKKQFVEAVMHKLPFSDFSHKGHVTAHTVLTEIATLDSESAILLLDHARTVLADHMYETNYHAYAEEPDVLAFDPAIVKARREAKDPFGDGIPF